MSHMVFVRFGAIGGADNTSFNFVTDSFEKAFAEAARRYGMDHLEFEKNPHSSDENPLYTTFVMFDGEGEKWESGLPYRGAVYVYKVEMV